MINEGQSPPSKLSLGDGSDGQTVALSKLVEVSTLCGRPGVDMAEALRQVLSAAIAITGADKGNIQLLDESSGELLIAANAGFGEEFLSFFARVGNDSSTACAAAAQALQRVTILDVTTSPLFKGQAALDVLLAENVRAVQSTPLVGSDGVLVGMVSTHSSKPLHMSTTALAALDVLGRIAGDYVQRQKLETALRQSEKRLKAFFENAAVGTAKIDASGRFVSVNDKFCAMSGYSREELVGRLGPSDLDHPEDAASDARRAQAFFAGETQAYDHEKRFVRKDGEIRWVHVFVSPIKNESGGVVMSAAIVEDVTASKKAVDEQLQALNRQLWERLFQLEHEKDLREQAQEALARSQRMEALGQLAGGMAHDFNNLLLIITGNLELAETKVLDEEVRKILRRAITAAEKGADVTQRLLSFARRRTLAPAIVSVRDRVRDIADLLRRSLGSEIDLELRLDDGLWMVRADAGEIDSAIVNIAMNARDAMQQGGTLVIYAENVAIAAARAEANAVSPGDYVCLSLTDTGHGMAPEVLAKAIEPFFTTKGTAGTGLGLSSVYGFAHQSGGFVELTSQNGAGTCVRLYLPRSSDAGDHAMRGQSVTHDAGGDGQTILVVDDDASVRQVTCERLRNLGYTVIEAKGGEEAVAILQANADIRLVLSDIVMPGAVNGHELAAWVRREKPEVKVLLASGDKRARDDDLQSVSPAALTKPYSMEGMALAVRAALDG